MRLLARLFVVLLLVSQVSIQAGCGGTVYYPPIIDPTPPRPPIDPTPSPVDPGPVQPTPVDPAPVDPVNPQPVDPIPVPPGALTPAHFDGFVEGTTSFTQVKSAIGTGTGNANGSPDDKGVLWFYYLVHTNRGIRDAALGFKDGTLFKKYVDY